MRRIYPHHETDVEHADNGSDTNHLPVPSAEKNEHEHYGDSHKHSVGTHLYLTELLFNYFRDGQGEPFTSKHKRIATNLTGYSEG